MRGDTGALNNRIHRLYSIFSLLIESFIKIYRKGEAARILPTQIPRSSFHPFSDGNADPINDRPV